MPTFLAPLSVLFGLIGIPIVMLYILRQKRPDYPVSSTLLWSKALADLRASSPWQRLRRNLLLFIQLLVLAALVLTMMRPVVQATTARATAGVIVIDCSASMQATDGGGPSRLDRAKEEATKLVDSMKPNDQYMLLADGGGSTRVDVNFTTDKTLLHQAIAKLKAADTPTDLSDTLILAATQLRAKGADSGTSKDEALAAGNITLFSDGVGVTLPNVEGIDHLIQFIKIGESANNVGIVRLSVTPVPKSPRTYQVFLSLINSGEAAQTVPIGLAYNTPEKLLPDQVKSVVVPGRVKNGDAAGVPGQATAIFQVTLDPGKLYVQIEPQNDDFKLDNTAYALIEPDRKVHVCLVTAGNQLMERYLRTATKAGELDYFQLSPEHYDPNAKAGAAKADLYIMDGFAPVELPAADTLLIRPNVAGKQQSIAGCNVLGSLDHPVILRYQRENPLLNYVELADVRISSALKLEKPADAVDLISSPDGSLLLRRDDGASRRYLLAFHPLLESNWWQDPSLLIFMENLIRETRSRRFIGKPQLIQVGDKANFFDLDQTATITLPEGSTLTVPSPKGTLEFPSVEIKNEPLNNTDHVGFYQIKSGEKEAAVAVNLLNPSVSDIEPKSLETKAGGIVNEAGSIAKVNTEIWPWVALAGLAILSVEWLIYHRRLT